MANAYYEKIARINLTTGKIKVEPLDLELAHKFIGGRGLGTKMLYDEGIATVDPLSPENKLIYYHRSYDRRFRPFHRPLHGLHKVPP